MQIPAGNGLLCEIKPELRVITLEQESHNRDPDLIYLNEYEAAALLAWLPTALAQMKEVDASGH